MAAHTEARMLYESPHVRVDAADGIATLWFAFPGTPVNALTPARLADLDRGLSAVFAAPHIEILVIRSGMPAGFCGGHDPAALTELIGDEGAQTAFALTGQRVLGRLAEADIVTVAFIEGPCLGPGLELAQACDYRLVVAGPDSRFGFADAGVPPCWWAKTPPRPWSDSGTAVLLTAREAHRAGVVDDAFCERRSKIELRTFLDRLQFHPRKPRRWFASYGFGERTSERHANLRARFRAALRDPIVVDAIIRDQEEARRLTALPQVPPPEVFGFVGGDDFTITLAVEAALRGGRVTVAGGERTSGEAAVGRALAEAIRRGRATPLEAETTRSRIQLEADIGALSAVGFIVSPTVGRPLAFLEPCLLPRAIVAVPSEAVPHLTAHAIRPDRYVGCEFDGGRAILMPGPTTGIVAAWLTRLGVGVRWATPAALPTARAAA